ELKLLKNNLASQIIQDNLCIGLEIIANREDWVAKVNGIPIKSLIEKKTFVKAVKMLYDLDIIMLEQILDIEGVYLMIWQQIKISRKKSKKEKKVIWFKEVEER